MLKEVFENSIILGMISNVINIRLEEILKTKEKSLYWLSKQTGIAYNALSKINKNEVSRLELETIEKICINLDCKPGELLELK